MTKYNWSSYFQGGQFKKGGRSLMDPISLKKSAKSQYYSTIKSDYEDYYDEHHDDVHVISKKRSSSFKETSTTNITHTTTTTTTTATSSSSLDNINNVGEELEWMLVIYVCDEEELMKRYDVPLRYISSSPVFKALIENSGNKLGAIVSQGWLVLPCSIRFFESVYNLAMCQAIEEEEEAKEKTRCRSI